MYGIRKGLALAGTLVVCAGCASGTLKFDRSLAPEVAGAYRDVAITVVNDVGPDCPASVAENLQAAAVQQMTTRHRACFDTVRPETTGSSHELHADVHITGYSEGSRFARAMLIGLGASKIATHVVLVDAATGTTLAAGDLSLVWAMGGALGASKGIEDLVNDAGAKIADAVAQERRAASAPQP